MVVPAMPCFAPPNPLRLTPRESEESQPIKILAASRASCQTVECTDPMAHPKPRLSFLFRMVRSITILVVVAISILWWRSETCGDTVGWNSGWVLSPDGLQLVYRMNFTQSGGAMHSRPKADKIAELCPPKGFVRFNDEERGCDQND